MNEAEVLLRINAMASDYQETIRALSEGKSILAVQNAVLQAEKKALSEELSKLKASNVIPIEDGKA